MRKEDPKFNLDEALVDKSVVLQKFWDYLKRDLRKTSRKAGTYFNNKNALSYLKDL